MNGNFNLISIWNTASGNMFRGEAPLLEAREGKSEPDLIRRIQGKRHFAVVPQF